MIYCAEYIDCACAGWKSSCWRRYDQTLCQWGPCAAGAFQVPLIPNEPPWGKIEHLLPEHMALCIYLRLTSATESRDDLEGCRQQWSLAKQRSSASC